VQTNASTLNLRLAEKDERATLDVLARVLRDRDVSVPAILRVGDESIALPNVAIRFLGEALATLARGRAVAIASYPPELLPGEAADILGVPPKEVARLIDEERLPHVMNDAGYQVHLLEDVLSYKARRQAELREGLIQLIRMSEELGLYEEDGPMSDRHDRRPTG
jgi:hypothetical protein